MVKDGVRYRGSSAGDRRCRGDDRENGDALRIQSMRPDCADTRACNQRPGKSGKRCFFSLSLPSFWTTLSAR
jgi:hypothetical protein